MHKHIILIADDDKNFREILALKLKSMGFEVIEAENGKKALDKLQTIKSDLVILDLKMPIMDGVKALDEIKSHSVFGNVKVIFLSNYGEDYNGFKRIDEEFAKELGAVNYVRKGDDLDKIVSEIEEAIHK